MRENCVDMVPVLPPDEIEAGALADIRREDFCRHYARHGVAARAAREAGLSETNPGRMLAEREIRMRIGEIRRIYWGPHIIEAKEVMERLSRIIRFDPKDLFDENGRPLPLSDIPDEVRESIASIKHTTERDGDDHVELREFKIADKLAALQMAMKHHKLLGADNEITVNIGMLGKMDKARERVRAMREKKDA